MVSSDSPARTMWKRRNGGVISSRFSGREKKAKASSSTRRESNTGASASANVAATSNPNKSRYAKGPSIMPNRAMVWSTRRGHKPSFTSKIASLR